jgi:adenylate kinase
VNILMLAPPGAGKGTQAERLSARLGIEHIASGDLLRAQVAAGTDTGREAEQYLAMGDLVPDRLVTAMLIEHCTAAAAAGGFILDGFPRTLAQAEAAYEAAQDTAMILDAVISLEVSDAELRRRMLARSHVDGRPDDNAEVIDHRLSVYAEQTAPLLAFYADRGILKQINGEQPVEDVFEAILAELATPTP